MNNNQRPHFWIPDNEVEQVSKTIQGVIDLRLTQFIMPGFSPFLPSVLRHALLSIRGTPVGLPRFRNMR